MEKLERATTYLLFFLTYICVHFFLVLNFGDGWGKKISLGLTAAMILVCIGLVVRNLSKRMRRIGSVMALLFFAGLSIAAANLTIHTNEELNANFKEKNPSLEDKGRFIWSKAHQTPQHKEMKVLETEGILFFYTEENKKSIPGIVKVIQETEPFWDELFGPEKEQAAIEFTNNPYIEDASAKLRGARGYFNPRSRTISVNSADEDLEYVLKHEYTHFRVHQYKAESEDHSQQIPQWFNEGFADVVATYDGRDYVGLEKMPDVVDFRKMDTNNGFHEMREEGVAAYQQSFVAVRTLINLYGFKQVVPLFQAKTTVEFYEKLEQLTGKPLNEFEKTLMR